MSLFRSFWWSSITVLKLSLTWINLGTTYMYKLLKVQISLEVSSNSITNEQNITQWDNDCLSIEM